MDKSSCLSAVFVILATNVGIQSLRLVSLDMPTSVMMGEPVWLNCTLDYENVTIYSVKWYKNDKEFYHYLPQDNPPDQIYDLPGVYADWSKSSQGQVYLNTTDHNSDGTYRCEASADAPNFQTVDAEKELTVYALPEEAPTMLESSSGFDVGQEINATCIAAPSKPAAKLIWYINGEPAPKYLQTRVPTVKYPNGLESSSLLLSFEVTKDYISDRVLNLRCESTVSETYSKKTAVLVIGDKSSPTEPPEEKNNDTTPTISGGQTSYITGNHLNVNCTSAKALTAPQLDWFINYLKAPEESLVPYSTIVDEAGMEMTVLGLRFVVGREHFDSADVMKLKCVSTLSRVIDTKSVEKILENTKGGVELFVAGSVTGKSNSAQQTIRIGSLILLTLLPFL